VSPRRRGSTARAPPDGYKCDPAEVGLRRAA
jgi:hypothetical protein